MTRVEFLGGLSSRRPRSARSKTARLIFSEKHFPLGAERVAGGRCFHSHGPRLARAGMGDALRELTPRAGEFSPLMDPTAS